MRNLDEAGADAQAGGDDRPTARALSGAVFVMVVAATLSGVVHLVRGVPSPGPNSGYDAPFALMLQRLLAEEWAWSAFPIRWLAGGNDGLGSPAPHYYGIAAFIPGVLWQALGVGPGTALSITIALMRVAGLAGAFVWLRGFLPRRFALLGAALFILSPYNLLNNPLGAFRFAESIATGLLPWLLVAVDRTSPGPLRVVVAAPAFALLAYTHLQQAVLAAVIVPAWVIVRPRTSVSELAWTVAAGCVGALIVAPHLLPAALERGWINAAAWAVEQRMQDTMLFGSATFRRVQLFGNYALEATRIATWVLCAAAGAAAVFTFRGQRGSHGFRLGLMTCLLVVSMLPPAVDLWRQLPLADHLQFSWRHLTFASLFAAACAAVLSQAHPRGLAIVLLLGLAVSAQVAIPWSDAILRRLSPAAEARVGWLLPRFGAAHEGPGANPPEYLPRPAASSGAADHLRRLRLRQDHDTVTVIPRTHGATVILTSADTGPVVVPMFAWPAFACEGCDLAADPGTGLLVVRFPPDAREVSIVIGRSPAERLGRNGFAIGIAIMGALGVVAAWRHLARASAVPGRPSVA